LLLAADMSYALLADALQVCMSLDGQSVGYTKIRCCDSPYGVNCSVDFEGFAHTHPSTGNIYYKAFKFGALKPAAGAATVEHPDQMQAGRIEITCEEVLQLPGELTPMAIDPTWGTDAANKKLPEGEQKCQLLHSAGKQ
jgi:hypothetical protein